MGKSTLRHSSASIGKSRFVIASLASFVVGIFFGDLIHVDLWWVVGIAAGILLALIVQWREEYWRMGLLILFGLIIGLGYFNFWDIRQKAIVLPFGKEQTIEAPIVGHPDFSGNQANYVLKFNKTKIRLTAGRYPEYHYGDVLRFKGKIQESYPYFFHQGILGQVYSEETIEKTDHRGNIIIKYIYLIRDKFEESLNRSLSEPYASFAAGLVLGSKRNIPDSLMSDFNRTGTTHIVAVSGYNITIIIVNLGILFGLISRKFKFWGSIASILVFVIMTGAPASVVRAGILAGLVAFGRFEGRRINMTILLLLVALVILFFNPYALKFDISFQLSFLAFAGLVYLSPIISNLKIIKWLPGLLKNTFSETLGAQVMVLPILIIYFGRVSIVSPVVNILILTFVPLTMGLVFAIGIGGLIWATLGQIIGYLGWFLLKYIIIVVENFSKIPFAAYQLKTSDWWWLPIIYLLIGLIILKHYASSKQKSAKA